MRNFLFVVLTLVSLYSKAQFVSDTLDLGVAVSTYFLNSDLSTKSTAAIGPSFFINNNGKWTLQLGFLIDTQKHIYYQLRNITTSYGRAVTLVPVKYSPFYIPVLFHYNYFKKNNLKLFVTTGFIISNYLFDPDGSKYRLILTGGTGASYCFINKFEIRLYPAASYFNNKVFPSLFIGLSYNFSSSIITGF